jgi:hypothetical protein
MDAGIDSINSAPLKVLHQFLVGRGADLEHLHRHAAAAPHAAVPAAACSQSCTAAGTTGRCCCGRDVHIAKAAAAQQLPQLQLLERNFVLEVAGCGRGGRRRREGRRRQCKHGRGHSRHAQCSSHHSSSSGSHVLCTQISSQFPGCCCSRTVLLLLLLLLHHLLLLILMPLTLLLLVQLNLLKDFLILLVQITRQTHLPPSNSCRDGCLRHAGADCAN